MIGNLDPDERIMSEPSIIEQINSLVEKLKWETGDNIVVEVGGVAATGTATDPGANPKWAKPFGTVTYQKDAFIVIKNKSRDPEVLPANPDPNLKPHHKYGEVVEGKPGTGWPLEY